MNGATDEAGLVVRVNPRAKRISLKLDAQGPAILVLPHERFRAAGLRFAQSKHAWLAQHRAVQPPSVLFVDGADIPIRGRTHRIRFDNRAPDPIACAEGNLTVGTANPSVADRLVLQWLKTEARSDLLLAVRHHVATLGLPEPPVTLRDPRTRWGSCSSKGRLSLSWRLILAPSNVLDYVAAHEVAHLVELNHSSRFWALVQRLCPGYQTQERWLKTQGRSLHRYG